MGKARLCVVLENAQGLNLNANQKLSIAVKLFHRDEKHPICNGISSTLTQWGAMIATQTRRPILQPTPQTISPQYIYFITLTHEHGYSNQHSLAILLALSSINLKHHPPKSWQQLNQSPVMLSLFQADNH